MDHSPHHASQTAALRAVTLAAAIWALAGCASMAPPHETPALPVPAHYAMPAPDEGTPAATTGWRDYFTDPRLQALIAQALPPTLPWVTPPAPTCWKNNHGHAPCNGPPSCLRPGSRHAGAHRLRIDGTAF